MNNVSFLSLAAARESCAEQFDRVIAEGVQAAVEQVGALALAKALSNSFAQTEKCLQAA